MIYCLHVWKCKLNLTSCVCCSSTVEQEQIQKRTFTNWVNAQLSKVSCVSEPWPLHTVCLQHHLWLRNLSWFEKKTSTKDLQCVEGLVYIRILSVQTNIPSCLKGLNVVRLMIINTHSQLCHMKPNQRYGKSPAGNYMQTIFSLFNAEEIHISRWDSLSVSMLYVTAHS